jgi:light-dependent protochlorophyllide reductase
MKATKTVIITGANTGLGFECAKAIASSNQQWHILMACRNLEKAKTAQEKLIELTDNQNISILELDLSSLQSVRNFVKNFEQQQLPPLLGLVNNAGLQIMSGLEYTVDGFEKTFGTNHLGHFLLTNLLLDKFQPNTKIVVVSSGTHDPDSLEGKFNKPVWLGAEGMAYPKNKKEMSGIQRYATSKLANLFFAYELSRRVILKNISVNAFDPAGVPDTNLLQSIKNGFARGILRAITKLSKYLGVKISTPEVSGSAMARLILDEKMNGVTGKYYQINEAIKSSKDSYDTDKAIQLWTDSERLVRL